MVDHCKACKSQPQGASQLCNGTGAVGPLITAPLTKLSTMAALVYATALLSLVLAVGQCTKEKDTTKNKTYQRIAAGSILAAEILWKLGPEARRKTAAVPLMIDDPQYSTFTGVWPKTTPRYQRTSEEIILLKPDLIILASYHSMEITMLFQNAEIDTVTLTPFTGFESYRKNVLHIARLAGLPQAGQKIISDFDSKLAKVRKMSGAKKEESKKNTVVSFMYGNTMGSKSTFHDVAEAAGLINLPAQKGIEGIRRVTVEELQVWQPDFIVIGCSNDCPAAEAGFAKSIGLSSAPGKVIAVPTNILTASNDRMLKLSKLLWQRARLP